jgi:hypothetical protein
MHHALRGKVKNIMRNDLRCLRRIADPKNRRHRGDKMVLT